jgi:hypothetical protein
MKVFAPSCLAAVSACVLSVSSLHAQGTLVDYQRAHDLRAQAFELVVNVPGPAHWIGDEHKLWYAS